MAISPKYQEYIQAFGRTLTLADVSAGRAGPHSIALRHDVDHDLDVALEMGRLEYDAGARATYFVLHTAPYWQDPLLVDKCLQLQDYGHEVGLHVNLLTEWMEGRVHDIDGRLAELLAPFRDAGVRMNGIAAHGDQLCYGKNFINYWCFSELRPADPEKEEDGRTAEGPYDAAGGRVVRYPASHTLARKDGARLDLWSTSMARHGIDYHAWHLDFDGYFSDSGGGWTRTADPLKADLSAGRHQVLMHPIHWLGPRRTYFFLSTARSGSKWLATFLDTATPLVARHEYMLNHAFHDGEALEKATGQGFAALAEDREAATALIAEGWNRREEIERDYAEVNVYLESFVDILKQYFPDAFYVFLHRDPRAVVRSIISRDWYDSPADTRHRRVAHPEWEESDQFARACIYVADAYERLIEESPHRLPFEQCSAHLEKLERALADIDIVVHPRLAALVHSRVVNATTEFTFPTARRWSPRQVAEFDRICGAVREELGYDKGLWARMRALAYRLGLITGRKARDAVASGAAAEPTVVLRDGTDAGSDRWRLHGFKMKPGQDARPRLEPDPDFAEGHRHVTLAGSVWGRQPVAPDPDGEAEPCGWSSRPGTYLTGTVQATFTGQGRLALYLLGFNAEGKLVQRRSMGVLSLNRGEVGFATRVRADVARFDVALYASQGNVPDKVDIDRVELALKPLPRGYSAIRKAAV